MIRMWQTKDQIYSAISELIVLQGPSAPLKHIILDFLASQLLKTLMNSKDDFFFNV